MTGERAREMARRQRRRLGAESQRLGRVRLGCSGAKDLGGYQLKKNENESG